jgi:signal transduction histidine kinase
MPERTFRFRPSARLQRYLGSELIADPNVAIIEFVKNSYDAGASTVVLTFRLDADPTSLTISDDGVGMNEALFRDNWMRPGFSEKGTIDVPRKPRKGATPSELRQASRVPVGEKGIGRLAAGRLGEKLDVFTRRARNQPWLHVDFDWRAFDDMYLLMEDVQIPYDFETSPDVVRFPVGTTVVISELTQGWGERVRGRAVRGRRKTRLGRLKQDLEFLVRPMGGRREDFKIVLESDVAWDDDDLGEITPESAATEADYSYVFSFESVGDKVEIAREIRRSKEAAELAGAPRHDVLPTLTLTRALAKKESRPSELTCGRFEGQFLYNPPPAARRAREIDESPVGVLVYRDGVLVEPYGLHENDWLGVRARKAQRQGHAAIQPDTFFGHVQITRRANPQLRDQTNRLGLLEVSESDNFVEHVRAEFRFFEDILYTEILESRWEGNKEEEARKEALEAQERSRIFLRALAHALRQPLQGLGYTIVSLQAVRDHPSMPPELIPELDELIAQTRSHVTDAEQLIKPLLEAEVPQFASVRVASLVEQAVKQNDTRARDHDVAVVVDTIPNVDVLVAPQLVEQALASILNNAIEAPRPNGTEPTVWVTGSAGKGSVVVRVRDDGTGIRDADPTTPLAAIPSTKGRPAVGLQSAESALTATRARLRLLETGQSGTSFEITLPTRVRGLDFD